MKGKKVPFIFYLEYLINEPTHKKTYNKTCVSSKDRLTYAVWSESSLITCAFYSLQAIQRGINENPCFSGWMYRLMQVFSGYTGPIISFVVHWLKFRCTGWLSG